MFKIIEEQVAGKALGEALLDQINSIWHEYEQEGLIHKDLFFQTVKDVINGEYFG